MARYRTTKLSPHPEKKRFPIVMILAGVGLLLVALWAVLSSGARNKAAIEVTGAPKIKVDQEAFDYGDVKLGAAPITTVVRVTNVGDQPLRFVEAPYIEVLEGC